MRRVTLPFLTLALLSAMVIAGLGVLLATAKPVSATAPDYGVVSVGGLEYDSTLARPVDPANAVDAGIVRGLPAAQRAVPKGQELFGAFVSVTNHSRRALPSADSIELRDGSRRVYRPLHLPAANPYAYSQRSIPPRTSVPRVGSAAEDNLAATGYLLLFRVPVASVDSATLELVIHDPRDPSQAAGVVV